MARRMLRRLLEQGLGAPGRALLAWRTRARAEALLARRGLTHPAADLAARLDGTVRRGPFTGMRYPRRRGDIVHAAKLLGSYECELHPALERLLARRPDCVVNVGSGDGYYAVGIARRLAASATAGRVIAVDPDPLAQRACAATARANGVGARVEHRRRLDARALEHVLAADAGAAPARVRALVVADCEGCEDGLLDPRLAPSLAHADLLVETHDFACPGVTQRLTDRFAATHHVERIAVAAREAGAFPELSGVPPEAAAGLLDEFRHLPQSWLVLFARGR